MKPEERPYDKYLKYIQNTGGEVKIEHFDEDWEPIGHLVRQEMVIGGLISEEDGKIKEVV